MEYIHILKPLIGVLSMAALITCSVSCRDTLLEENQGRPISLSVVNHTMIEEGNSPFHIMSFGRNMTGSKLQFVFEDDCLVGDDGLIRWSNGPWYWTGDYCKFIAYWPADSKVAMDTDGNIVSGDCELIATATGYSNELDMLTLTFVPFRSQSESPGTPIGFDVTKVEDWLEN